MWLGMQERTLDYAQYITYENKTYTHTSYAINLQRYQVGLTFPACLNSVAVRRLRLLIGARQFAFNL